MMQFLKYIAIILVLTFSSLIVFAQVPLSWTRDEINPGEDFTLIPDESFLTEGLKSLHMQLNSGAVPYLVSDVFYVTPGAEYEFSIDVFDHDTAGQVKVYADFYDAYGFNIFGRQPVFSSDSSEWQAIRWEGAVPGQAVVGYVLIKFYNQPDLYHFTRMAEVWIDNVQFRQAGGENLTANGGFENWTTGIEEPVHQDLSIYPNPAKDFIHIVMPGDAKEVFISDITGKEVLRENASGNKKLVIDLRNIPAGLYIFHAIINDGSALSEKLMIF